MAGVPGAHLILLRLAVCGRVGVEVIVRDRRQGSDVERDAQVCQHAYQWAGMVVVMDWVGIVNLMVNLMVNLVGAGNMAGCGCAPTVVPGWKTKKGRSMKY